MKRTFIFNISFNDRIYQILLRAIAFSTISLKVTDNSFQALHVTNINDLIRYEILFE